MCIYLNVYKQMTYVKLLLLHSQMVSSIAMCKQNINCK